MALQDGVNCLLAEASPAAVAERVAALIDDPILRRDIAQAGTASVTSDWEPQVDSIWQYLRSGQ